MAVHSLMSVLALQLKRSICGFELFESGSRLFRKLSLCAAGNGDEGEVSLAADENGHVSLSSDDRACKLSMKDQCAQPYERSGLTQEEISCLGLRYFGPSEIARLHSFPEGFSFPKHVTLRQQYALLGNSVSALVIGDLLKYLLHGSESQVSVQPVKVWTDRNDGMSVHGPHFMSTL